jgi:hypothetical protein
LAGWHVAPAARGDWPPPYYPLSDGGRVDYGAQAQVWARNTSSGVELLVQFRDIRANGKSHVTGRAGTAKNTSNLGFTSSIGAAPNGAWCSDISRTRNIRGALTYDVGGVNYYVGVSGTVTVVRN